MKSLEEQFRKIIIDSVPKNIDLTFPVNQDTELKTLLTQIYNLVNTTNENVKIMNKQLVEVSFKVNSLLREEEGKKWNKIFGGQVLGSPQKNKKIFDLCGNNKNLKQKNKEITSNYYIIRKQDGIKIVLYLINKVQYNNLRLPKNQKIK